MPKVIYEKDGRIGRITLNRPEVLNAVDDDLPVELGACVERANADARVHIIVLSGAGEAFCAGYDLAYYTQGSSGKSATQAMPWDPMKDYAFMMRKTEPAPLQVRAGTSSSGPTDQRAREALGHYDRAIDRLKVGDWGGFGTELDALRPLLEELSRQPAAR